MRTATMIDPLLGPSRQAPPLRLALGRILFRVTLLTFLIAEIGAWRWFRKVLKGQPPPIRIAHLIHFTPRAMVIAFGIGAVVAVSADLLVRFIVRPLMARW